MTMTVTVFVSSGKLTGLLWFTFVSLEGIDLQAFKSSLVNFC